MIPARKRLHAWMIVHGLTQQVVAARAESSQSTIQRLLDGTTEMPTLTLAVAIERLTADWADGAIKVEDWDSE